MILTPARRTICALDQGASSRAPAVGRAQCESNFASRVRFDHRLRPPPCDCSQHRFAFFSSGRVDERWWGCSLVSFGRPFILGPVRAHEVQIKPTKRETRRHQRACNVVLRGLESCRVVCKCKSVANRITETRLTRPHVHVGRLMCSRESLDRHNRVQCQFQCKCSSSLE